MDIVSVIIGLVIGFLVGFITTKSKKNVFNENETAELKTKNAVQEAAIENAKDIIACGFDINKTFVI
jgi:tryptophanyl-tRNA synthetase